LGCKPIAEVRASVWDAAAFTIRMFRCRASIVPKFACDRVLVILVRSRVTASDASRGLHLHAERSVKCQTKHQAEPALVFFAIRHCCIAVVRAGIYGDLSIIVSRQKPA
jgi:hypothetical protein